MSRYPHAHVDVIALTAMLVLAPAAPASAAHWEGFDGMVGELRSAMRESRDARVARLPDPVDIQWQRRRIADFDFRSPVLAAAFADLEPGGAEELVILTTDELVVLRGVATRPEVAARLALPESLGRSTAPPRDPLGAIVVERPDPRHGGSVLRIRSSANRLGAELPARLPLAVAKTFEGIPLCGEQRLTIAPGRNLLAAPASGDPSVAGLPPLFHAARCGRPFYGASGALRRARAVVDTAASLALEVYACGAEASACDELLWASEAQAGTAFSVTDLDRDGYPELVAAGDTTPGSADRITIWEARPDGLREELAVDLKLGVAAVAIGQADGDPELEVVTLQRRFRSTSFEVWLWN